MAKLSKTGKKIMGVVNILIGIGAIVVAIYGHTSGEFARELKHSWMGVGVCLVVAIGFFVIGGLGLAGISLGERGD